MARTIGSQEMGISEELRQERFYKNEKKKLQEKMERAIRRVVLERERIG